MKPIKFKEQNVVYVAGGCGDLPAYKDNEEIISVWKPNFIERIKLLFGKNIYFNVMGKNQPPISMHVGTIFIKNRRKHK